MDARSAPLPRRTARPPGRSPARPRELDAGSPGRGDAPHDPFVAPPMLGLHARQAALVVGILLVAWIVFIFARAVATTSAAHERADHLRAANAAQEARLAAEQEELTIVQGQPFIKLQARAYGVGAPGERPFALAAGASSPRPIVPLGAAPAPAAPETPLDAWLVLLFGP
ncbi:MAG: hypothetical protein ACRDGL_10965 [Candidatus Limnocylindrales bacterium]